MRFLLLVFVLVGLIFIADVDGRKGHRKRRQPRNAIVSVSVPSFVTTDPKYRIDCAPDADQYESFCQLNLLYANNVTTDSASCINRGCMWDASVTGNVSHCYIPWNQGGYTFVSGPEQISPAINKYQLTRKSKTSPNRMSLFGRDVNNLNVHVSQSGTDALRMTIRDADNERYEVPVPIRWEASAPQPSLAQLKFELTKTQDDQVGFRVTRTKTGTVLFDTSYFANGFVYDDQYIQIITTIPTENVYGFGENTHPSLRHRLKNSSRYGIFARDQWPSGVNENLYGTHPFYMGIESTGDAFGVFIFNSNAQDYKFDDFDTNQAMLTYRTIGGIMDVLFFAGPTPEAVIRQYQLVIGNPYMPPYWALGFQISRYEFNSLQNMEAAVNRTLSANIPLDIVYGDIDYFDNRLDFTYNKVNFTNLPAFIDSLHARGMKFITILDPAIDSEAPNYSTYTDGQNKDIWIKWPISQNLQVNETKNRNMLGYVWPDGKAVFPDFFYPPAKDWWIDEVKKFHTQVKFDGIWIDMNEPANFDTNFLKPWNWYRNETWNLHCPIGTDRLDGPPYKTAACGSFISDKTLCMIGEQTDGTGKIYKQYDTHNLYGWSETLPTLKAARAIENKRSIVISRSTFPSSGAYTGHWTGDNAAHWSHLKYNIIGIIEFNLFGIPYIGADICGFFGNTTEPMCQRWMQLGAFNPFFRNHNGRENIDQDPGIFSPPVVASNRRVVETRYTLNPFLYTLFHRAHVNGGTVIRSMAHVFPTDSQCWSLDEQFLWGTSLLIAPVIYENDVTKSLYLPTTERWYDYYTGNEQTSRGNITVPAPMDFVPLYLRGGSIIPHQEAAMNTVLSRKKPMYLVIALDNQQSAYGDLFWDDGDSIDTYENSNYNYFIFNFQSKRLIIEPWTYKYTQMANETNLDKITVYGLSEQPARIVWNGQTLDNAKWSYNTTENILNLQNLGLDVSKTHRFILF